MLLLTLKIKEVDQLVLEEIRNHLQRDHCLMMEPLKINNKNHNKDLNYNL
jgi:hypothetical protein